MCVKSTGTKCPCRNCLVNIDEILFNDPETFKIRDSDEAEENLTEAFSIFCKKIHNVALTNEESASLHWCQQHSCLPLLPAIFKLEKPYEKFSKYEYSPPDMLHTLTALLEFWICSSLVCISEIGKLPRYRNQYRNNLGKLDGKIAGFPRNHSIPISFNHFVDGVTAMAGLGNTLNSKNNKNTGMGSLGLIDYQDVSDMTMQLLLCKSFYTLRLITLHFWLLNVKCLST